MRVQFSAKCPANSSRITNSRFRGNTAATAPPDELALPTDKSDALECEHAKEIQGAAELCIRPSKVAVMKSETELNMKYNAMV